jgi:hypothetical protein
MAESTQIMPRILKEGRADNNLGSILEEKAVPLVFSSSTHTPCPVTCAVSEEGD